jgi:hypothetical protein
LRMCNLIFVVSLFPELLELLLLLLDPLVMVGIWILLVIS